jgi:hypothetical protein
LEAWEDILHHSGVGQFWDEDMTVGEREFFGVMAANERQWIEDMAMFWREEVELRRLSLLRLFLTGLFLAGLFLAGLFLAGLFLAGLFLATFQTRDENPGYCKEYPDACVVPCGRNECAAFSMGGHPRLGSKSRILTLDPGIVKMILEDAGRLPPSDE